MQRAACRGQLVEPQYPRCTWHVEAEPYRSSRNAGHGMALVWLVHTAPGANHQRGEVKARGKGELPARAVLPHLSFEFSSFPRSSASLHWPRDSSGIDV